MAKDQNFPDPDTEQFQLILNPSCQRIVPAHLKVWPIYYFFDAL